MRIAEADVGTILQPARDQQRIACIHHRRGHIDPHVGTVRCAQQIRCERSIAGTDFQDLFASGDRQQGDGGTVEVAVAAVHGLGHDKRMLAVRVAQLGGQIIGGKHAPDSCRWAAGPGGGGVHPPA